MFWPVTDQNRQEIEALATAQGLPVTCLGFVNLDELPKVYAAADVLAHVSDRDAHPLVLSEAASVGLPIIASDRVGAVGPTDIARPGENAIIVPVGDRNAIASSMARLAGNRALRDAMGVASVRIFASQNTAASIAGLSRALAAVCDWSTSH